jgi:hypothetical protein
MTYRRSPREAAAKREWTRFVESNHTLIAATGMPAAVMNSPGHFDDLLAYGRLDHPVDPSRFVIDALTTSQYEALVTLTECYFAAGYEWFTPAALRPDDQERLRMRFAMGAP